MQDDRHDPPTGVSQAVRAVPRERYVPLLFCILHEGHSTPLLRKLFKAKVKMKEDAETFLPLSYFYPSPQKNVKIIYLQ
jgi:hypothetical protein